jgi:hypothetical protein
MWRSFTSMEIDAFPNAETRTKIRFVTLLTELFRVYSVARIGVADAVESPTDATRFQPRNVCIFGPQLERVRRTQDRFVLE